MLTVINEPYFFQDANQSWNLKIDFLDLSLSRSYYSGTRLTVCPFFGARGAWIRQALNTEYVGSTTYAPSRGGPGYIRATVNNEITSWGVGPRTGFESNWLLGYGTRLIGNASGDILYTRYSLRQDSQAANFSELTPGINPIISNPALSQTIDYLRAHTEIELGFGWGSYFDNHNWHIDLSATYGFQTFWSQNMIRNFEDSFMQTKSFAPNGNLYVHGMNLKANMDF
jgi:hypothetical protein